MNDLWTPSKDIHLPKPKRRGIYCEVGAWDEAHRVTQQGQELSRSPTRQFLEILLAQMGQANVATVKETDGTEATISEQTTNFSAIGTATAYGIVIGTGSTAIDIEDYQLVAQVTTNWVHNTMVIDVAVTVADPDCTFDMYRNFNNNTGAQVVIAEVGIYCRSSTNYYCIFRDVPGSSVTVPDGGGCYVKYTLKVTE